MTISARTLDRIAELSHDAQGMLTDAVGDLSEFSGRNKHVLPDELVVTYELTATALRRVNEIAETLKYL